MRRSENMTDKTREPRKRNLLLRSILFGLIFFLAADFITFAQRAADAADNAVAPPNADAVVVLTGGGARLATAAELARGMDLPMFISGVNPDSSDEDVAAAAGLDEAWMACCVTSGRLARTTAENGLEVAEWANETGYEELIIVTSAYHLERALLEMRAQMPVARLHGYAVTSPVIDARRWWRDVASARRMLIEWAKWRVVSVREGLAGNGSDGHNMAEDALES